MSVRLYDKALTEKIQRWINNEQVTITSPDETRRLFQWKADKTNDSPIKLPLIAIRRGKELTVQSVNKKPTTFDGLTLTAQADGKVVSLQSVPITIPYQIDIYTRFFDEADDYIRNFIFNIINYPSLSVDIPYNDAHYLHTSNITMSNTVSDNSDIPERLIPGQFTRMTIQLMIDDAYLWSVPIRDALNIEAQVETKLEGDITNA